jgi:NADH:ubiquinone oxidoreductase subunit
MCVSTWLYTKIFGKLIGRDEFGNSYYESIFGRDFGRKNRWVYYKGLAEGSKVPAEWFRWLHYQEDAGLSLGKAVQYRWKKQHLPNLTGTKHSYHPITHELGQCKIVGDYKPWRP